MKKINLCFKLFIIVTFSLILSSCRYYTESEQQEIINMFNSFDNSDQYIVQADCKLRIGEKIIDLEEIKYNEYDYDMIILEEKGFYAYSCNEEETELYLLFVTYEDSQIELLDKIAIPARIRGDFYLNNALYFIFYDSNDNVCYIVYNMLTKEITTVDADDVDVDRYSIDKNRSAKYKLTYKDSALGDDVLYVTNKETGVEKKISKSLLNTFEEGKLIESKRKIDPFSISSVFVREDDFYFIGYFGLAPLGDPCYYYIWKWNFETEQAEYYSAIYFETYPEDIADFYILDK